MKTLSERMNMKFGAVSGAHVMTRVSKRFAAYDTLCLICAELDTDLSDVSDYDFESASDILEYFVMSANDRTGYVVSVWFD